MEKFPVLRLITKYGPAGSMALGALVAVFVLVLAWPAWGAAGLIPAAVLALLAYVVGKSYVELVVLITDMLMPQ
jgi:hypothetical protein